MDNFAVQLNVQMHDFVFYFALKHILPLVEVVFSVLVYLFLCSIFLCVQIIICVDIYTLNA